VTYLPVGIGSGGYYVGILADHSKATIYVS